MKSNPSNWKNDLLPVEQVSWYDVVDYCNKRSIKEGLTPCYSGSGNSITCDWRANGYRLPTESEWEFAARGGNKGKGYKYSGSNDIGSVAWYNGNSGNKTQEVGTKSPNELGIHDMSGNVWEWCWDRYNSSYYAKSSGLDSPGATTGLIHMLCGGSWGVNAYGCRLTSRDFIDPAGKYYSYGFRVVRAAL